MKNLILILLINTLSLFSYSQVVIDADTVITPNKLVLYGQFVNDKNVKVYFYKSSIDKSKWEYSHSITYFSKYEFSLDTNSTWLIQFEKGVFNKSYAIIAKGEEKYELDIDIKTDNEKTFIIYQNIDTKEYKTIDGGDTN